MQQEAELQEVQANSDAEESFSPLEVLHFVASAAKRHKSLGLWVGAGVATLGVLVALAIPANYAAESRVLAVQSSTIASLTNPDGRANVASPFAGDIELLMQKSNLHLLVQQTDLLHMWQESRPTLYRAKDRVFAAVFGEPTEADLLKSLVELLMTRMYVTNDASVLAIRVQWQSPDIALKIAQAAQSRFFELKKEQELSTINATIGLHEDEIRRMAESIDQTLEEVVKLREKRKAELAANASRANDGAPPSSAQRHPSSVSRQVAQPATRRSGALETDSAAPPPKLAAQLAELRQRARDLETPWQRRQAELKFQLNDLRGTYGPEHPVVLQQEAKIREASMLPVELAELRASEQQLLAEIENSNSEPANQPADASATNSGWSRAASGMTRPLQQGTSGTVIITEREDDPILAPAKARLQNAITSYTEVSKRLERARMQLAAAQVALQYRYVVVTVPELPRKPVKPNRPVLIAAALVGAVFLGFLTGAVRDLLSGRVFEPWQLRKYGLPVLGEVNISSHSEH